MRSSGVLFILMFIAFQLYGMKYDVEDNDNREDSKSVVLNAMSSPIGHLIKINILWELCGNVNNVNIKEFFGDDDTVTIYPSNTYWSHVSELFNNPFDIITNIPCKSRPRQITYETNHYKTELSDNRIKHEVSFVRELFFPFGADFILQSNDKAYTYSFLECSIIGFLLHTDAIFTGGNSITLNNYPIKMENILKKSVKLCLIIILKHPIGK